MSLMARYARPRVTKRPDIRPHLIIATRDALASREESIYRDFPRWAGGGRASLVTPAIDNNPEAVSREPW